MTKVQLSKYIQMGRELRLVEEQIARMPKLVDRVQASDDEFPYLARTVTISGIDTKRLLQLRRRRAYLKRRRAEVEGFVDGLEDRYMQRAIWLRYITGATWIQIGHQMNTTYESVKKAASRYLTSVCKSR